MTSDGDKPLDPIESDLARDNPSFTDLVLEFVEGLDDRLSNMDRVLSVGDFKALQVAAHQLKGTGGGYGYPSITERAAKLEQLAKQEVVGGCEDALTELRKLCERVVARADE